ncbi:hypothetical protein BJV78DRAFT_1294564 [Lactifluus subvellereus]|nr:hypothetical protein BJV78DRAFT_1294564 [Lactifluus subvellereus]
MALSPVLTDAATAMAKRAMFVFILELLNREAETMFFALQRGKTKDNRAQREKKRLAPKRARAARRERNREAAKVASHPPNGAERTSSLEGPKATLGGGTSAEKQTTPAPAKQSTPSAVTPQQLVALREATTNSDAPPPVTGSSADDVVRPRSFNYGRGFSSSINTEHEFSDSSTAVAIWLYSQSTWSGDRDFCLDCFHGGTTSVEIFECLAGLLEKKDHDVVRKTD